MCTGYKCNKSYKQTSGKLIRVVKYNTNFTAGPMGKQTTYIAL